MTPTQETPNSTALTGPLALAGGVVIALGGLTGAAAGVLSATGGDWSRPDAFVVFFGVTSLVAAVLGSMVALGKLRDTVGMTLLIGAGSLLVGGALSEPQLVAGVLGQAGGDYREYHGVLLKHLVLAQIGCAALGTLLCALQVWSRKPEESIPQAVRSAIAFALLGAIIACFALSPIREAILDLPKILVALVVGLGGVLAIVCTAAGGHTLIRSFEVAQRA